MAYRRILVGTDGSETATEAVRHAAELAGVFDAELVVLTAFTPDPTATARAQEEAPDDIKWRITDSAAADEKATAAAATAKAAGAHNVRCQSMSGDPASALVDVAEELSADVIVVGSKGMASPARFILGSVPNTVSHHAPCDVLIVHTV